MEKHLELIRLYNSNGVTVAACYNRLGGYFKEYSSCGIRRKRSFGNCGRNME